VGSGTWVGDNIYNNDGSGQTVELQMLPHQTEFAGVKVENDGGVADSFTIKGDAGTADVSVSYWLDGGDVTGQVVAGTLASGTLQPGENIVLTVRVTRKDGVLQPPGCKVTATSASDPAQSDTVGLRFSAMPWQPDLQARPLGASGAWVGAHIYSSDGRGQVVQLTIPPLATVKTAVRVVNDGGQADRFTIRGSAGTPAFPVLYWLGGVNVTRDVIAGTLRTGRLQPGGSVTLTVWMASASASPVPRGDCKVTATSVSSPSRKDAVRIRASRM
jgi:hypothetical protein